MAGDMPALRCMHNINKYNKLCGLANFEGVVKFHKLTRSRELQSWDVMIGVHVERLISRARIRELKVEGFSPRRWAAPSLPDTRQLVALSARMMF
jgi:hypothetical protein